MKKIEIDVKKVLLDFSGKIDEAIEQKNNAQFSLLEALHIIKFFLEAPESEDNIKDYKKIMTDFLDRFCE